MAEKKVSVRLVAENGRQVRAELEGVGDGGARSFQRLSKEGDNTGAMLRRLAGIAAGALSIRQVVQYADTWTDLRSRVDLATGSQERGVAVMDRLAQMARHTYSSVEQTTESWLANSTALRELGLSTAESLDFTEALNNAMVISGARAERAASVQTALSRAMALGTLSGQNLNNVIQNGGRVAELLAEELGTTVSGLREMGRQGLITGDVIRTALVGNLELLRDEADSMPATIGPTFNAVAETIGADARIDWFGASSYASMLEHAASNVGAMAERFRRSAAEARAGAFEGVTAAMQALRDALSGEDGESALDDAAAAADRVADALDRAGTAGRQAGADTAAGAEKALRGWDAVAQALTDDAEKAREIGGDIGNALVGAFHSAENAVGEFVKSGKMNFRDLVTSMLADMAKLGARRFLLGPLVGLLSGFIPGLGGGLFANILHAGGMVDAPGPGRMVPALAFANAPRMHSGGRAGLRPDEVPAILQRGERVLSRREAAGYGTTAAQTVNVTINARDAESFRQSRTQIAADIARAVSLGRRGM